MADDLHQRYAEALDDLDYGHDQQERRYVFVDDALEAVMAVRDEELERLRLEAHVGATDRRMNFELRQEITRLRINAEKDVCSGCMQREEQRDRWMEASRQIGVKYEAAKQRWYEQQDRAEDAEQERDEWRERAETAEAENARARALHPSWEEAEAAQNVLCPECAQPAPCKTRRALDDDPDAGRG